MDLPHGAAVKYFMQVMDQVVPDAPEKGVLSWQTWGLRQTLIDEEYAELVEAYEQGDHAAFLDACVDLVYVVIGTAVSAGLPFDAAFAAVHEANMRKLHPCKDCGATGFEKVRAMKMYGGPSCGRCKGVGGHVVVRDDGKVMKPVGWRAPDIASIIGKATDAARTTTA